MQQAGIGFIAISNARWWAISVTEPKNVAIRKAEKDYKDQLEEMLAGVVADNAYGRSYGRSYFGNLRK